MRTSAKYNYCTLLDSYYLTRGISLYKSLERHCKDFHLYFFAFDDKSVSILKKLNLEHSTIVSLNEFENQDLISVKLTRTTAEYCWTCTASTIWYSITKFNLDHCTYLDADMLFFSSPVEIYKEIGSNSVGITPHNFSKGLKSSEIYGKYCVQFTYFKNDVDGMEALEWWKDSCIEWCYAKMEHGKYGDQKYLDYFQDKFKNVCVINNIGVGVAPWNVSKYNIKTIKNKLMIELKAEPGNQFPLIFYHFQGLKFEEKETEIISEPSVLKIENAVLKNIYVPYINQLLLIKSEIDGSSLAFKEIIFKRELTKSISMFLRINLKRFTIIRVLYTLLKKSRHDRLKGIGTEVN